MPPRLFGCGSAALWFVFPVPSVSCPMWGRLSSLRPAFQPALAPLYPPPSAPPNAEPCRGGPACPPLLLRSRCSSMLSKRRRSPWSKPPGLPCRRSRRQSHTIPTLYGSSHAIRPARLRAPPQPASPRRGRPWCPPPLFPSPCPPWFGFLSVLRTTNPQLLFSSQRFLPPRERVAGQTTAATPVWLRLCRAVACFSPCSPCSLYY